MTQPETVTRYNGRQLADQAGSCMVLKAFLKKQALRTSSLSAATSYAEAAAMVDAYLNALCDVHRDGGLLDQRDTLRAECERLKMQVDSSVAPEELRQWQAECERLRAENQRLHKYFVEGPRAPERYDRTLLTKAGCWEEGWTAGARVAAYTADKRVQAFRKALEELLGHWYHQRVVDDTDDDQKTGRRPCPMAVTPTIADVRRWRAVLAGGEAATLPPKRVTRCLGCHKNVDERDCGCPAGTYETEEAASPQKDVGWFQRQAERIKKDVAELPSWMRPGAATQEGKP